MATAVVLSVTEPPPSPPPPTPPPQPPQPPPPPPQRISIEMNEFNLIRRTLRFFGFWQPEGAWLVERWGLPVIINLLLLALICIDMYGTVHMWIKNKLDLSQKELFSFRLMIRLCLWLSHILTIFYFKTRDIENNMLNLEIREGMADQHKSIFKWIWWMIVFSLLYLVALCALPVPLYWKLDKLQLYEIFTNTVTNATYESVQFADPYFILDFPIRISLTWVMYLLYRTSKLRLMHLYDEFLRWEESAEDAIYRHHIYYCMKIKTSSGAISWLFLSHNIFMIFIIPISVYLYGKNVFSPASMEKLNARDTNAWIATITFTGYFIAKFVCWASYLHFAESLKTNEEEFVNRLNKLCPKYIQSELGTENVEDTRGKMFASRTELNKLLSYLKDRKCGLFVCGYRFQIKASLTAFYITLTLTLLRAYDVNFL